MTAPARRIHGQPIRHPLPEQKVWVDNGWLVLPNGKKYSVSRLTLSGTPIDLSKGLSHDQLEKIAALVSALLNMKPLKASDHNLKTLRISIDPKAQIARMTKRVGIAKDLTKLPEILHAEFKGKFFAYFLSMINQSITDIHTAFDLKIEPEKEEKQKAAFVETPKKEKPKAAAKEAPKKAAIVEVPKNEIQKVAAVAVPKIMTAVEAPKKAVVVTVLKSAPAVEAPKIETPEEAPKKVAAKRSKVFPKVYRISAQAQRLAKGREFISHVYTLPTAQEDLAVELVERQAAVTKTAQMATAALKMQLSLQQETESKLKEANQTTMQPLQKKLTACQANIEYYKNVIDNCTAYQKHQDWLDCNAWRHSLHDHADFDKAVTDYIPAPVNMRYHALREPLQKKIGASEGINNQAALDQIQKTSNEFVGFMRLGVITDDRNGWFSLAFLKHVERSSPQLKKQLIGNKINAILAEAPKELQQAVSKRGMKLIKKIVADEAAKYSVQKTHETTSQKLKIQSVGYALMQLQKLQTTPAQLPELIHERRLVLQDKMLQLVAAQVERHPSQIRGHFKLAHIGFVDGHKSDLDASGWRHDEEVSMQDMGEIFEEFDGARIQFGDDANPVEAPYIDHATMPMTIFLPAPKPEFKGTSVPLDTYYMNMSPHKHTKNDGAQETYNKKALDKLRAKCNLPKVRPTINFLDRFQKAEMKGSYGAAEDLVSALLKSKEFALSMGCASAKDRTGLIAARTCQRALEERYPELVDNNPFAEHIFEENMPAVQVVFENTNMTTLKVVPLLARGVGFFRGLGPTFQSFWDTKIEGSPYENRWAEKRKVSVAQGVSSKG